MTTKAQPNPSDVLTTGHNAETSVTFFGNTRDVCNVWTNDRVVFNQMARAGLHPTEENAWGVTYRDVPTKQVFRPIKKRKPMSAERREKALNALRAARDKNQPSAPLAETPES
jgi:hypothetical protein